MNPTVFQRKKRSWIHAPWVTVLALVLIIGGLFSVVRAYIKKQESVVLKKQYEQELVEIKKQQEDLTVKIENLSTKRGIESEIRDRYRVAKEGEQLVIVVDNEDSVVSVPKKTPWFQKIRYFIGL